MFMTSPVKAGQVTLAWDDLGNKPKDVGGYYLYYWRPGDDPAQAKQIHIGHGGKCPGDAGLTSKCYTLTDLPIGQTYHFAVTAHGQDGQRESALSNQDGEFSLLFLREPVVVAADSAPRPLAVEAVTASSHSKNHRAANVLDGDLSTRWSANGKDEWLQVDLGREQRIDEVQIAWFKGNQRRNFFALQVSSDGAVWRTVWDGESSGQGLNAERFEVSDASGRFVRYLGKGNSQHDWNSVTELAIHGAPLESHLPVVAVKASSHQGDNVPSRTLDGNLATRWSAQGTDQWIQYDLGQIYPLSYVMMAWFRGDKRQALFGLQVSLDGRRWQTVVNGKSRGNRVEAERIDLGEVSGRFVRYLGKGNTSNRWNSVTSVTIHRDISGDTETPDIDPLSVSASSHGGTKIGASPGHIPGYVLDGDLKTRWSANGKGQWMVVDLGRVHGLNHAKIAWFKGDRRRAFFELHVSTNGTRWKTVFDGASSGRVVEPERFDFTEVSARFVRYFGKGNSASDWNSVTAFSVHAPEVAKPLNQSASQAVGGSAQHPDGNRVGGQGAARIGAVQRNQFLNSSNDAAPEIESQSSEGDSTTEPVSEEPPAGELVANGGFEDVNSGQPFAWELTGEGWQVVDTDSVAEAYSLYLKDADLASQTPTAKALAVTLTPGIYVLSAWVKTDDLGVLDGGQQQGLRLLVTNDALAEQEPPLLISPLVSGTQDWRQMVMRVEVLETSDYTVWLEAHNLPPGLAWVDEVSMTAERLDQFVVSETEYTESELAIELESGPAPWPVNGSFENLDAELLPLDWALQGASWRMADMEAQEGRMSLSLQDAPAQPWWPTAKSLPLSLEAGTYVLSGWVKAECLGTREDQTCTPDDTPRGIRLVLQDASSMRGSGNIAATPVVQGTREQWQFISVRIDIPVGGVYTVGIEGFGRPNGQAWIDTVQLRRD